MYSGMMAASVHILTYITIFSYTNRLSERGLMTESTVNGQKMSYDLVKEYGKTLNVPLTKVSIIYYF